MSSKQIQPNGSTSALQAGAPFFREELPLTVREAAVYLGSLDVVFNFEALFAVDDPPKLAAAIESGLRHGGQGWVLSNHDFNRLATRAGTNARAVALLLFSMPGPVFVYQGDELGFADAQTVGPELDRHHRDGFRVPMIWDDDQPQGGFSAGEPWLVAAGEQPPGVRQQSEDGQSTLTLARQVIALRERLGSSTGQLLPSADECIVMERDGYVVAVNLGAEARPAPALAGAQLVLEARAGDGRDLSVIPAHGGWIAQRI